MVTTVYQVNDIKTKLAPVFAGVPIDRAILFGSYAKGNATADSDVDIVIDSKGKLLNMAFYGVLEDIQSKLDKHIDLFEISELKRNTGMLMAVEQEGIVIFDRQR